MKMRSSGTTVAIALVSALILLAVTPAGAQSAKVGLILPLTGPTAGYGKDALKGAEFAKRKLESIGVALDLLITDEKNDPAATIAAARRLVTQDQVAALVGPVSSTVSMAMVGAIKPLQPLTLLVGPTSSKIEETYGKEPWMFHAMPYDYTYAEANLDLIMTITPRPQTIAIAYEAGAYGTHSSQVFRTGAEKAGFRIVANESFKSGSLDLGPMVTRLRASSPDVVVLFAYVSDAILFTRQARAARFNAKLMLAQTAVGTLEYKHAIADTERDGIAGLEMWLPELRHPASAQYPQLFPGSQAWSREYQEANNEEPSSWSALGYLNVALLGAAVKEARSTERDKIIAALERLDTVTHMGPFRFSVAKLGGIHQGLKRMVLFQWQGGKKVVVHPADVATGRLVYPKPDW